MRKILFIFTFALLFVSAIAQKNQNITLGFLRGETELNVIFDYSNVIFTFENGMSEERYVERQTIKEGDEWRAEWEATKDSIKAGCKHSKFFKDFNLTFFDKNYKLRGGDFPQAKYTMVVEIRRIWLGNRYSPLLYSNSSIILTNSVDSIAEFQVETVGNPYGKTLWQVESLYERIGKELAKLIVRKIKKH